MKSEAYAAAGVDVTAGYEAVKLMRKHVESTFIPGVLGSIGGFGGMFELDIKDMKNPVLVSGTDGVGTKLKIAFALDKHDTVGVDAVAMCVNDVICCGARPLFFLDYIACGKNIPSRIAAIVAGVARGCRDAGCALIGGETAEMPGFYPENEYDIAGFCTAIVDRDRIIDGTGVTAGCAVIGVASSGIHSNGFSLVRKILNVSAYGLERYIPELGRNLGEELLEPTRIYVGALDSLKKAATPLAVGHITGGGFFENLPRMLPDGLTMRINKKSVPRLPVFDYLQICGKLTDEDLYSTFNMGMGLAAVVRADEADAAVRALTDDGYSAFIAGETLAGGELILE